MISRRIFAAPALLCALAAHAHAQTGSPKTPAQLNSEINTLFQDNSVGGVTPAKLRQVTLDQVASIPFPNSAVLFSAISINGSLTTYYVNTSGDDSNTCLTTLAPCKTLQGAWNKLAVSNSGLGGGNISVADGTYSAGVIISGAWMGAGPVSITGNSISPGNVIINAGAAQAFTVSNAAVTLSGMELRTTGGHAGIFALPGADVSFSNLRFGGDGSGNHMTAKNGGRIHCIGNYQIVAGGESHIHAFNRGFFDAPLACTATLTGAPNFTSYFAGASDGDIDFTNWTPSGTATGQKFFSHDGARISSGGLGLSGLPGSVAGSLRVLGQYDNFFGGPNAQITANDNTVDGPAPDLASQMQTVAADGALGGYTANAFANQVHITGAAAFGTGALPLAVSSTVPVMSIIGRAFDGSSYGNLAAIDINTIAGVTPSDHGGYITFRTVPAGSTGFADRMRIGAGVGIGTGITLLGAGTLNVSGLVNAASYQVGGVAGVSCSGSPTGSFASVNGIVTHC